jgi:uncharacterized protein YrrD
VDDVGAPIAYEALETGTPVLSRDRQQIGTVKHVLAAEAQDIFEGIVIATRHVPGRHRFVDADQIASMHERGIVLTLDAGECERLPEPSANPPALGAEPDGPDDRLAHRLRRAWDLISGNY